MSYRTDPKARKVIDCVLRRNAMMFANLGKKNSSMDYANARTIENERLRRIRHLDPEMIDGLIID